MSGRDGSGDAAARVPGPRGPADRERAARRQTLLRELEEMRSLRAALAPRRERRLRLERLHTLTRLSA